LKSALKEMVRRGLSSRKKFKAWPFAICGATTHNDFAATRKSTLHLISPQIEF